MYDIIELLRTKELTILKLFAKKKEFQPAEELLDKMGFIHSQFLVGVNEHINKRVNVYYHSLVPMQSLNSYSFTSSSKTLTNGDILVENNYSFGDCFLRDDIVPNKESTKREWVIRKFEPLTKWLAGDNAKKRYKVFTLWSPSVETSTMTHVINDMYNELIRITNNDLELVRKLTPMLIANNYQSIAVMLEIAKHATEEQIAQYVQVIIRTEEMKLPVNDYQLLFDTMDNK